MKQTSTCQSCEHFKNVTHTSRTAFCKTAQKYLGTSGVSDADNCPTFRNVRPADIEVVVLSPIEELINSLSLNSGIRNAIERCGLSYKSMTDAGWWQVFLTDENGNEFRGSSTRKETAEFIAFLKLINHEVQTNDE